MNANSQVAAASHLQIRGYSRNKRHDCLQFVITLIITHNDMPIGYEVVRGNTSEKTTLRSMLMKSPFSTITARLKLINEIDPAKVPQVFESVPGVSQMAVLSGRGTP